MLTNITCCEKTYILGLSKGGIDVDQIAEEIKRLASGIYKILKKCDEEPSTKPVGKQGRPSKLTEGSKRSIANHTRKNRRAALGEITNASVDNVSKATVRHALHEVKLNNRIARMKPYLSNKHITQRLIVAGHHLNWTLEQWSKVIWTWLELSIFHKRYEILVTSGILSKAGSRQLNPFLGPSVPFSHLTSKDKQTTNSILISSDKQEFLLRERNLRNWKKPSSSFTWAAVSKRFAEKGFVTIHPLHIANSRNKTINLMSFVLYCISKNNESDNNYQKMLALLAETPFPNIQSRFIHKKRCFTPKTHNLTICYS